MAEILEGSTPDIEYDERVICRCCGGTTAGQSNLCRECSEEGHVASHEEPTAASERAEQRAEAADERALRLPRVSEAGDPGETLEETRARMDEMNADSMGTDPGEIPGETVDEEGGDPTVAEQIDEAADEDAEAEEQDESEDESQS